MGICKFVSSAKLVEYLEQEFLEALNNRGLYDISQFGWLDDDLPDPDYQGLARWQSGELVAAFSGDVAGLRRSGDGFVSHMHTSLHSLGLALVFADGGRENVSLFCEEVLGSHCRDVVFKLGLASICLRDFFIILTGSGDGNTPSASGRMNPGTFQAPFARVRAGLGDDEGWLRGHYRRIESLAADIAGKCHLCERFSRDLGGMAMPFALTCPEADKDDAALETTVEVLVHDLCDWYELLIETGNAVFMLMADMSSFRASGRVNVAVADPPESATALW